MRDPARHRVKSHNPEDRLVGLSEFVGSELAKAPVTVSKSADLRPGKPGCAPRMVVQRNFISPDRKSPTQLRRLNLYSQKKYYPCSKDIQSISVKSKGTVNEIAPLEKAGHFDSRSQHQSQDGGQFHSSVARALDRSLPDRMTSSVDVPLSDREIETISHLAAGYGAKEVARALNISPRTVEHRIEALKRRFGARNVTHLVAITLVAGWIHSFPNKDAAGPSDRSSGPCSRSSFGV